MKHNLIARICIVRHVCFRNAELIAECDQMMAFSISVKKHYRIVSITRWSPGDDGTPGYSQTLVHPVPTPAMTMFLLSLLRISLTVGNLPVRA